MVRRVKTMSKKCLKIAVTGGIGSGKSYALNILKDAGYFTVSCDGVYKGFFDNQGFLTELKKLFPTAVIGDKLLKVDKKALSDIVFNDERARQKLNDLTHPLIIKECFNLADNSGRDIAFIEVPLLFEGGYQTLFDKVIIITRSLKDRIDSVTARSNLSLDEIQSRINAQIDYDVLDKTPYITIENSGDFKTKLLETIKKA